MAFACACPCRSPCTDTAATFVSPPPTGSDTNCCLGFGTERFSWFVCLGHALIELWGFSLRSLQLFYVNYSLQPGVSFSWLSCTFLVSCFLDSRFCFFRPLSALNQVELTASLAQALDNINLYLDFTLLPDIICSFVCLAFAFNFQLPHKYECYKFRIISRISFPTAEAPQQINRLGASASAPACSTFVYLWLGAPCPCFSALLCSGLVAFGLRFHAHRSGVCRSHLSADNVPGRRTTHRF